MNEREYLNEEKYQKNKRKITRIAYAVLTIGLLIGGGLIALGVTRQIKTNDEYSTESKELLNQELNTQKEILETKKSELESNGVKYNEFAKYTDNDEYSLKIITKAMDPSFDYCSFDEYKNNYNTKEYCTIKNKLKTMDDDFSKRFDSFTNVPFYMFGGFVIVASFMIFTAIYTFAKRREIIAFQTEQIMPVAKEGMEEVAPSVSTLAKEITKGIKDGMK